MSAITTTPTDTTVDIIEASTLLICIASIMYGKEVITTWYDTFMPITMMQPILAMICVLVGFLNALDM